MTSPITDFIEARLKADQEAAEAAQDLMESTWQAFPEGPEEENYSGEFRISNGLSIAGHVEEAKARHMVLHQPARVLREVAAKRALLEHHGDQHECTNWEFASAYPYVGCSVLRELAAVYSDHPEFNPEWTVTS